ncbi:MAG TPA: Crp/Fnr family transcriptional regulator [Bacteroidia bacterium]|nr:Crp/Fnr family transcriptional regulator [Bacteroidia bacterium]
MKNCNLCLIHQLNSFKTLSKKELDYISEYKKVIHFKKGDLILEEGKPSRIVYCLMSGKGKLSKYNSSGKEQIIRFVKSGNLIGYRSVFNDEAITLNLTAIEDVTACAIPKHIFKDLLKNSDFTLEMLRLLSNDLKFANMIISHLAQHSVRERLAETLLHLQDIFGTDKEGNINMSLSREELANIIGTASESVIRILSNLKKEKVIFVKAKKLKLLNKAKLYQIAEGLESN